MHGVTMKIQRSCLIWKLELIIRCIIIFVCRIQYLRYNSLDRLSLHYANIRFCKSPHHEYGRWYKWSVMHSEARHWRTVSGHCHSPRNQLFGPLTIPDLLPSTNPHPVRESIRQPRASSGSCEKQFFGLPSKGWPAKNLYTELDRLAVSFRVTWAWSERFDLRKRLIVVLSRKTKIYTNFSDPLPPSWPPGFGNSYRLPARLGGTGNLTPVFQTLVSYPHYRLWLLLIFCIKY